MAHSFARESAAVLFLATALYVALALLSFRADPDNPDVHGQEWVGPVGATLAEVLVTAVGLATWIFPIELAAIGLALVADAEARPRSARAWATRFFGDVTIVTICAALVHVAFPDAEAFGKMPLGGLVGEHAGELMRALFSSIGSFIIGLTVVALILVGRASFSFIESARRTLTVAAVAREKGKEGAMKLAAAWEQARTLERQGLVSPEPPSIDKGDPDAIIAALSDDDDDPAEPELDEPSASDVPEVASLLVSQDAVTPTPAPKTRARAPQKPKPKEPPPPAEEEVETPSPIMPAQAVEKPASVRKPPKKADKEITIVDTSSAREVEKAGRAAQRAREGFKLPAFDLLDPPEGGSIVVNEEQLKQTAGLLEKTLADYGVSGRVEEIHPGPTVTTFEVSPAAGTKVSKVASLADDLALGLSRKVRIIAPIPGKNRIGFEIPNAKRSPVSMRDLVEDRRFIEMKAPLPCVLGRDIVGAPYFADLASMPHVIVAGATGAGKSVGLNVILVSLLYRRPPEELRLLMIDPKVVELAPYDGIPHMLLPVVTDMKQAANALKWAVDEMERRYMLFAGAGTKNITTYNGWVERVERGEAKPPKPPATVSAVAADGSEVDVPAAKDGSDVELPKKLPFIVIVVDEFADLMMQQGKDVEAAIARLAQKARAAGMHVILATQRPSVDVITGMIKANFPTRVAFRVAQKVDSRTILDEQGAEHLLGKGDMLVKMNGTNDVRRVQCPFISEEETQKVTDHLRAQGTPVYDESILKPRDEEEGGEAEEDLEGDPMYDQAVRIVADTRRCSTSWLQRKLGIGYNRAAKLVEAMERRGLVGPANGAKDREVLISPL
ncbi:MAG: DNA translocase FtsK [Myxococcales bacterium]|nr:DNA translocase FtsK [Myxococcales bacterium]